MSYLDAIYHILVEITLYMLKENIKEKITKIKTQNKLDMNEIDFLCFKKNGLV